MKQFLTLMIFSFFLVGTAQSKSAIEILHDYEEKIIQNKDNKEQVIQIISGSMGINYDKKVDRKDLTTIVNTAEQAVLVNGGYYDWFDILKSSLNKQPILNQSQTKKYLVHQVAYYVINRFLQNESFKGAVHLIPQDLAKSIFERLKKDDATSAYTDLEEVQAIEKILKYGMHVLSLVKPQKSPMSLQGVNIESGKDEYIDIKNIYDYQFMKEDPYEQNTNKKQLNTGQILTVKFNDSNNVNGIDYPYQYPPKLLKWNTKFATYDIPEAIQKLTDLWGTVASPLNIENGAERSLYLFWISNNDDLNHISPTTGVLYGCLDTSFLPTGNRGSARIGRLIQLSKRPIQNSNIIYERKSKLEELINDWKTNLYPIQLFGDSVNSAGTKEEKIELACAFNIFHSLSTFDPLSNPWFILAHTIEDQDLKNKHENRVDVAGFPYFKIGKTMAVKTNIESLKVETLKMKENGELSNEKEVVIPEYFLSPLEKIKYENISKNHELKFYLIEHNGELDKFGFESDFYKTANKFLFTPKILYCAYQEKEKGPVKIFQASAGIPSPQMLRALYRLKLDLATSQEELDVELYEHQHYKDLGIPRLLWGASPNEEQRLSIEGEVDDLNNLEGLRQKLADITNLEKFFGLGD